MFSLQGKDATKLAGNWFQLLMALFTKVYLPTPVLCFLVRNEEIVTIHAFSLEGAIRMCDYYLRILRLENTRRKVGLVIFRFRSIKTFLKLFLHTVHRLKMIINKTVAVRQRIVVILT